MVMYRQGDLLIIQVDHIPKKYHHSFSDILLEGEATGHAHRILNGQVYRQGWLSARNDMGPFFIQTFDHALVIHEEHASIDIPKGFYRVVRQREYVPAPVDGKTGRRISLTRLVHD